MLTKHHIVSTKQGIPWGRMQDYKLLFKKPKEH